MKVVKIGAVWCPGCIVMKPRWQKIEKENPWLKTEYYDYDNDRKKIKKYLGQEEKLPLFIFLDKNNNEIDRKYGEISEKEIINLLNKYKAK